VNILDPPPSFGVIMKLLHLAICSREKVAAPVCEGRASFAQGRGGVGEGYLREEMHGCNVEGEEHEVKPFCAGEGGDGEPGPGGGEGGLGIGGGEGVDPRGRVGTSVVVEFGDGGTLCGAVSLGGGGESKGGRTLPSISIVPPITTTSFARRKVSSFTCIYTH